ncbi:transposable element Tcb2 transposase, partial [Trichonephila clavipes]
AAVAFPARPDMLPIKERLVTLQAMVGRHILEDIVGRVAQYVDEHYPVDKWHLGDLIAWVIVSQEIAPHTVTPCEIAVCRFDNKCRIGPLAGAPPDTCAVVISTETESGFITEDDTSPVCHTPSCPRSAKIQSTLLHDDGVSGKRLSDVGSLKPTSVSRLLMVSLDGTGMSGRREAGWSNRRIGRHLGRSDMVVARCWQQWITEGRVYRRGGSDVPGTQMIARDRAIRRVATSAPTTSLASIQRHLSPSRHPVPSRENHKETTDRSWLEEPTSAKTLPLTPQHRQCRLDFCRPRATWSVTDWRRVIFSDESRFSLSADDHRTRVWRRTGQRSDPAFIVERHTAISQGAIYQQDNARPHTARLSQQSLQGYDVLPWPARSPDLSPIEHVWTRWEGNCSRPEIQEN